MDIFKKKKKNHNNNDKKTNKIYITTFLIKAENRKIKIY